MGFRACWVQVLGIEGFSVYFPKLRVLFWGPQNKEYSILGYRLWTLILGNCRLGFGVGACDFGQRPLALGFMALGLSLMPFGM